MTVTLALDGQARQKADTDPALLRKVGADAAAAIHDAPGWAILSSHREPDGDLHVRLRVNADQHDPRGGRFTNAVNDEQQAGALVLEPVCEGPVTQPDAVSTCRGWGGADPTNPFGLPPLTLGSHVKVTGPWVLDSEHGWLQLHPLEHAEVLT